MNRVLLNNIDHHDLVVAVRAGAEFGDAVNQVPVFPSEFQELQREYPIVFRRADDGGIDAYALLGLDRDENLFLDKDRWTSRYVPAVQRRGPFSIVVPRTDDGDEPGGDVMIHVDLDDPRVGAADGAPLFLDHGGNAPYLEQVAAVLRVIFEGMHSARAVNAELDAAGLLQPVTMEIALDDETQYDIPDILTVDAAALAALTGEPLERLHRSGLLHAATMAAASIANVPRLIDLKNHGRATR